MKKTYEVWFEIAGGPQFRTDFHFSDKRKARAIVRKMNDADGKRTRTYFVMEVAQTRLAD